MQGRPEEQDAPSLAPDPEPPAEPRADTAVSPVIRGESVSIPTPAWGTAIAVDDAETVVAEIVDEDAAPPAAPAPGPATGGVRIPDPAPRSRALGFAALLLAVATVVLHAVAVQLAAGRQSDAATVVAWVAIGVSVAGVLGGIVAVVTHRGRVAGAVATAVALFANPWVLLQMLTFFAP